jgi:hypothetical protein
MRVKPELRDGLPTRSSLNATVDLSFRTWPPHPPRLISADAPLFQFSFDRCRRRTRTENYSCETTPRCPALLLIHNEPAVYPDVCNMPISFPDLVDASVSSEQRKKEKSLFDEKTIHSGVWARNRFISLKIPNPRRAFRFRRGQAPSRAYVTAPGIDSITDSAARRSGRKKEIFSKTFFIATLSVPRIGKITTP